MVHWAGTIFCNVYGIHSISDAGQRAGNLALVHLAPLLATTQLSFASNLMGLSLTVTRSIHRAFGLMAAVQSAFHTTVALTTDRQPQPQLIPVVTVSTTVFGNNLQLRLKLAVAESSFHQHIDVRLTLSAIRLRSVLEQPPPCLLVTCRNDLGSREGKPPLSPYTVIFSNWMLSGWLRVPFLTAALS